MIQYPLHEKEEKAEQNIKKTSAYIEMELFDLTFGNTKKASEVYDGWTDDRTGKNWERIEKLGLTATALLFWFSQEQPHSRPICI